MAKDLKDILSNESEFEANLIQVMRKVGRERDERLIDEIGNMSEGEFRSMIDDVVGDDKKTIFLRPVFLRAVAACAACILIVIGIGQFVHIGNTDTVVCASLFKTYYKGDKIDWKTFDAGDDRLNTVGKPSTAAILEVATKLLSQDSKNSVRKGVNTLEHLLTLKYKRSLEHEIRWYLALGYMKEGQIDKSKAELNKVISLNSPHSEDAKNILKRLK